MRYEDGVCLGLKTAENDFAFGTFAVFRVGFLVVPTGEWRCYWPLGGNNNRDIVKHPAVTDGLLGLTTNRMVLGPQMSTVLVLSKL